MKNKLTLILVALPISVFFLSSCEGSRPRRVYEAGKFVYEDYEKTGDPTWLIIFIILLVAGAAIWIWNQKKK